MRLWFQLLSSEKRLKGFWNALQAQCDQVAAPGTTIDLHGTPNGGLGDNYRFFEHFDTTAVLQNALRVRREGSHDAFVLANSVDPGLVALREILDIPVISLMEVACFTACTMGERFSLIVSNEKWIPKYREIVVGYGLADRLASVDCILFDNLPDTNRMYMEPAIGDAAVEQFVVAAHRSLTQGAEVLIAPGPIMPLLVARGIHQVEGAPVLDGYSLLVKTAETMVTLHRMSGVCVSRRRRYMAPSADLLRRGAEAYGLDDLRDG